MTFKIYPYKNGSRGAKVLANALGCKVLRKVGSKYRYKEGDLIINWGAVDCPFNGPCVANQPAAVDVARNKLTCFNALKEADVSIPPFWTKKEDIPNEAFPVFCRTTLTGHSGAGIVVANKREELVNAPLYTQYIKKKHEYRVHVLRNKERGASIICIQRKARRNNAENGDFKIRNLANGFVYVMADHAPALVERLSLNALLATGLAFGAVDVIWNEAQQRAYVLEINTAPGLEERTAEKYAAAFEEIA